MMNIRRTTTCLCLAATGLLAVVWAVGCDSEDADNDAKKDSKDYLSLVASAPKKALAVKCMSNLQNLHSALMAYSATHNGKVPATLDELAQAGGLVDAALVCPVRGGQRYVYVPPTSARAPSTTIIARDATAAHDGMVNVLRLSGSVTSLSPEQAGLKTAPAQP